MTDLARGARDEEQMKERTIRVEVVRDGGEDPWAKAYGPTWYVAVFTQTGSVILDITTPEGGVFLQHEVADILRRGPEVAELYGAQLDAAELAAAIEACRLALAEHALAELHRHEAAQTQEAV